MIVASVTPSSLFTFLPIDFDRLKELPSMLVDYVEPSFGVYE